MFFSFFFWQRVHVTSGENDRVRYPREGKGLVSVRSPISSNER